MLMPMHLVVCHRQDEDNSSAELIAYVLYTRDLDNRILLAEQLAALTTQDKIPWQVKEQIQCGWPLHLATDQQPFLTYFACGNELTVSHELIYWGHRVVLPEAAKAFILKE